MARKKTARFNSNQLEKTPSGIQGLDEITQGGLPKGRTTLICGGPGCGKTLFAMEFLVEGAREYDEHGVFVAFEETEEELTKNVASLHYDLKKFEAQKKLHIEHIYIERSEMEETGAYNLEGLFVRLGYAIDSIKAKRVVLDTIEVLFSGLNNEGIIRTEIRRLFRWLKEKGVTAVITGESGIGMLTRHGLEEYVSDCVIVLDHRVNEQLSTRRIRIVKYRGSIHATNEYPFLIDQDGISVLPVTSLGLTYPGTKKRVSTGIPDLDLMFGGKGIMKGSSVLVSGSAGTGKTSIAAAFAINTCQHGGASLYFSFEESPDQLIQNMSSIGLDLGPWVEKGLLKMVSTRPSLFGLEMHLLEIYKIIESFRPKAVIIDQLTSLIGQGKSPEIKSMLIRLMDLLKGKGITSLFTGLVSGDKNEFASSHVGLSPLIDTWIIVRELEFQRRRTRGLYIVKSRGIAHSNQVQKLILSSKGINLIPVKEGEGQHGNMQWQE